MPSQWIELSAVSVKFGIPRATLDSWARRYQWPSVRLYGRKQYPSRLVFARCVAWNERNERRAQAA